MIWSKDSHGNEQFANVLNDSSSYLKTEHKAKEAALLVQLSGLQNQWEESNKLRVEATADMQRLEEKVPSLKPQGNGIEEIEGILSY